MGPKKKKDLVVSRVYNTRKSKGHNTPKAVVPAVEADKVLDLEDPIDLPTLGGDMRDSLLLPQEEVNQDEERRLSVTDTSLKEPVQALSPPTTPNVILTPEVTQDQEIEVISNDSNGPVEVIDETATNKGVGLTEAVVLVQPKQNVDPAVSEPIEDLSDDDVSEILENKVAENMNMQTERLFDIIEELQRIVRTNWSNKDMKAAVNTLKFLKERANRVKSHSMDLPEYLERRPMSNQRGYEYISRISKAWDQVKELHTMAKNLLVNLPNSNKKGTEKIDAKVPSGSSVVSDLKEKNDLKGKELDARAKSITANSVTGKKHNKSPISSVVSVLKGKNVVKNKELDKRALAAAKAGANIKEMYGSEGGKIINRMLDLSQPPKRREGGEQNPKIILPQEYGSMDGDLQILDRTEAWVNADDQNSAYQPKILPKGKKLEEFVEEHPSVQGNIPRNRNFNIKPKEPRPDVKILGTGGSDNIRPEDSVSQPSRRHFRERRQPIRPNRYPTLEENWVCVPTKKHPQTDKPLHHGKIRSFRNLFENSFNMNFLFYPNAKERSERLKPIYFDGNNVEVFREFEQSVLIRIINNPSVDFDEKFLSLLATLGGAALSVAQSYSEVLDVSNFVKAIEDLYYSYGEPTKFRDTLLRQLMNEDPVDLKKPETLQKLRALIGKIFRAFGGDSGGDHILSTSFVMETIKMTPETAMSYKAWLCSTRTRKNLKAFEQWLEWEYSQNMEDNLRQKAARGYKNLKRQPILNATLEVIEENNEPENPPVLWTPGSNDMEETQASPKASMQDNTVLMSAGQAKIMEKRCQLCFGDVHKFANCRVFMNMTPDQRKIALLIRDGCFRCTGVGHIGTKCMSKMNCQKCQNQEHHESICEASADSWNAVVDKKWEKPSNNVPTPRPRKETEVKKTFLVQGEDQN